MDESLIGELPVGRDVSMWTAKKRRERVRMRRARGAVDNRHSKCSMMS